MSSHVAVWGVIALGIVGLTAWGNIEFWRRSRRRRIPTCSSGLSGFSDTIDECEARPLIHPAGLEVRRPEL